MESQISQDAGLLLGDVAGELVCLNQVTALQTLSRVHWSFTDYMLLNRTLPLRLNNLKYLGIRVSVPKTW